MNILGIDPGVSTGLACYRSANKPLITTRVLKTPDYSVVTFSENFLQFICEMSRGVSGDWHVVIEKFTLRPGAVGAEKVFTIEAIGACASLCRVLLEPSSLELASPSTRHAYMPRAKAYIQNHVGGVTTHRHEVDALAHLMRMRNAVKNIPTNGC